MFDRFEDKTELRKRQQKVLANNVEGKVVDFYTAQRIDAIAELAACLFMSTGECADCLSWIQALHQVVQGFNFIGIGSASGLSLNL